MTVTDRQLGNRNGYGRPVLEAGRRIRQRQASILLLPEMCFYPWPAAAVQPGASRWRNGGILSQTGPATPFATADIDSKFARRSNSSYPR